MAKQKKRKNVATTKLSSLKRQNISTQKKGTVRKLRKRAERKSGKRKQRQQPQQSNLPNCNNTAKPKNKSKTTVTDEDLKYFNRRDPTVLRTYLLGNENNENKQHPQKSRKRKGDTSEIESYEKHPRAMRHVEQKKLKPLLPIKHKRGLEKRWEIEQSGDNQNDEELDFAEGGNFIPNENQLINITSSAKENKDHQLLSLTPLQQYARQQKELKEMKLKIEAIIDSILSDPENNLNNIQELVHNFEEGEDSNRSIQKYLMISLAEVFKDICPGYSIREISATEKEQKVTKDVLKLRDYEKKLLKCYRFYLTGLESFCKEKKKIKKAKRSQQESITAISSLKRAAIKCFCDLLVALPHFNYRINIITTIVPYMDFEDTQISDMCCQSIVEMFKRDSLGEASLDAVKLIRDMIKCKSYELNPKVLDTFLALRIKDASKPLDADSKIKVEKMSKKEKMKTLSRRERKRYKHHEKLEKEMRETDISENTQIRQKLHTQIIEIVFAIYIRIIKKNTKSILLPSVLEGLAKYAHLINIDFFDDLMKVFQSLVASGDLGYRESLHCILSAFHILSDQGDVLNIDPLRFYTQLYNISLSLHAGSSNKDVPIMLRCLDLMVSKRRKQISLQRLLAYSKRLGIMTLHLMPDAAIAILAVLRSFLQLNPKADLLLDTDTIGGGVYMPELTEPEYCNPQNTALWELITLQNHYHPQVKLFATAALKASNYHQSLGSQLTLLLRKSPIQLFEEFTSDQIVLPPEKVTKPKRHKKKLQPNHNLSVHDDKIRSFLESNIDVLPDEGLLKKLSFHKGFYY